MPQSHSLRGRGEAPGLWPLEYFYERVWTKSLAERRTMNIGMERVARARLSEDPWQLHVVGKLVGMPTELPRAPRQSAPSRKPDVLAAQHYEGAAKAGLAYGPAFQSVAKVWLDPGETTSAELTLEERSFAYWEPTATATTAGLDDQGDWYVAPGTYELHVGRSSADVAHVVSVER